MEPVMIWRTESGVAAADHAVLMHHALALGHGTWYQF